MRITCPKCDFKGLIDSAPLAQETPVACVRCGTTFEAVLVEGEIQTSLLPENYESFFAPNAPDADAQPVYSEAENSEPVSEPLETSASEAEDVLSLPQPPEMGYQTVEPELALEDVLVVSHADAGPPAEENVLMNQTEGVEEEDAAAAMEACSLQSSDESPSEKNVVETASEPSFNFSHTNEKGAAEYDRQQMGMRLMRISPLWLLLCGVTFLSVIILSNRFVKPAEQEQLVATNFTAPSNKATNQTLSQPPAPASANPTATSVQDSSQVAAPAPVELKKEEKATEEKVEAKTQEETQSVAGRDVAPGATTNSVAPVTQAQSSDSAGGFTIQIGSYNVIEQANERVARLQSAGFDARVSTAELPKRGTWYRVQAGRFGSREEAVRYGNQMKSQGAADSFIITETQGGR